jgi:hypothetical protein
VVGCQQLSTALAAIAALSETGEETTPARGHGGPFPKKQGRKPVSPNGDGRR